MMIQHETIENWQDLLRNSIADWRELCQLLSLEPEQLSLSEAAMKQFPLQVPRSFVACMEPGNPRDPLLLQILPVAAEMQVVPGYTEDALLEQQVNPVPGLLHKYHGRVLLTLAGSCPINCRYCFRRHFPYQDNVVGREGWKKMLAYISADPTIREVIFSGGEPMLLKNELLEEIAIKVAAIPHVKILRIHSRMPVVMPARIDQGLLRWVQTLPIKTVMVLHCNHPHEISLGVVAIIERLRQSNVTVLNQSVLLKGVNDSVAVLSRLSELLFTAGCMPYYIHLLDQVAGVAHFAVDESKAIALQAALRDCLPGYLVPKFVREVPGECAKKPLEGLKM